METRRTKKEEKRAICLKYGLSQGDTAFVLTHFTKCMFFNHSKKDVTSCYGCGKKFVKGDIICFTGSCIRKWFCRDCYSKKWVSVDDEET
jgi:hypothetical protein